MQARRKVQKYPLLYALAEGVLLQEIGVSEGQKQYSNKCAQQFINYIKTVDFDRDYSKAQRVNEAITSSYLINESTGKEKEKDKEMKAKQSQQEYLRNIIQALSFNFTPDQTFQVFQKAMSADVPSKQGSGEKKTVKALYEEMYKLLNSPL